MLLTTGSSLVTFWVLRAAYAGAVVATLPFTPVSPFKMMTHQGLPGEDYTQASYMMFFVLTNMALKPVLARALKLEAPKVGGAGAMDWSKMFNLPTDASAAQ
jgi:calcium load-activated calcium channel